MGIDESRSLHRNRSCKAERRKGFRNLLCENLERREVMAGSVLDTDFRLLSVAANTGEILSSTRPNSLSESPRELIFRFTGEDDVDRTTLRQGIWITRSGGDGVFGDTADQRILPAYLDFADSSNQRVVVARFSQPLLDDLYRVEIFGVNIPGIPGQEKTAIRTLPGSGGQPSETLIPRRAGTDRDTYVFNLELGSKIAAIVPQPITRSSAGVLSQNLNVVEVYFNDAELYDLPITTNTAPGASNPSVVDPRFYNLIATGESVTPFDDRVFQPSTVTYNPATKKATLTFSAPIHTLAGSGTYRLRIGSDSPLSSVTNNATVPIVPIAADPQGYLSGAFGINSGTPISSNFSTLLEQEVRVVSDPLLLDFPGSSQEPGHRDIQEDRSLRSPDVIWGRPNFAPDGSAEIRTIKYNFMENQSYGVDSSGRRLFTSINSEQKQRIREIFEFYSRYLGVDFQEYSGPTAPGIFNIVVGDMIPVRTTISGPGDLLGVAGQAPDPDNPMAPPWDMVILDGSEPWDNAFGFGVSNKPLGAETVPDQPVSAQQGPFSFFNTAMHEIGHLLGLDHTYDLPAGTIMGSDNNGGITNSNGGIAGTRLNSPANPLEQIFPGTIDQIHGQHLLRPDNRDVDLYRFQLATNGRIRLETIAERLNNSSNLDTYLTLLRRDTATGALSIVAANNNYFSQDSFIDVPLTAGEYFVAVTGKGNEDSNPLVRDTGSGATSQGRYQLRFEFKSTNASSIVEQSSTTSALGSALDGDGDGIAGGDFNFWFRTTGGYGTTSSSPRTLIVDKAYTGLTTVGTLTQPFNRISDAVTAAQPGDIIRLAGLNETDPLPPLTSIRAYEIGSNAFGPLADGDRLEVPKGVTLMIDAGAILKMGNSRILVGSDGVLDRSGAAIQVLGTPTLPVFFSSHTDQNIGIDTNPLVTTPKPGDWGGIEIRNDFDRSQGRLDREREGIFLNTISNASMQYGGGLVGAGAQAKVTSPIELAEARPLILGNLITQSADSAISADPNSFEETLFTEPRYQNAAAFVPDYRRVGPAIYNNRILNNTINGLFVRVETLPGQPLKNLTTHARIDDTEVTIVFGENFVIAGTPGGPLNEIAGPNTTLMVVSSVAPTSGTGFPSAASLDYLVTYVDRFGQESLPSPSSPVSVLANQSVRLTNIPTATGDYVSRKIYRRAGGTGAYQLVALLNRDDNQYVDNNTSISGSIQTLGLAELNRARQDASLVIDPGIVAKLFGTRLEVGIGATLLAEGTETKPIIFTSRLDDRYGAGGTFDTNNDQASTSGAAGNWSGILARHMGEVSIDYARITFGGGESRVPGGFASFSAIEVHQSTARIANSLIENNASGRTNTGGTNRDARGNNDSSAIFVLASQPVIINNIIRDNDDAGTAAISVDLSSLSSKPIRDAGRATGFNERETNLGLGNFGPLVFNNRLGNNAINGMRVRGGTLTTESVWDDTDIVHVLQSEVIVPDFHTFGGLRLVSKADSSLVVKANNNAGITAAGRPLDIKDRIGGTVQILGAPGFPVVITSLLDDDIGAGFDSEGGSLRDTNNDGNYNEDPTNSSIARPSPGNWRSVRFTPFSNDRNVDMTYERESDRIASSGDNDIPSSAQDIGKLAGNLKLGDENLRLGVTLTGSIASPSDLDVYRFSGVAGATVWMEIDQSAGSLDSVVELIDASGQVMALSDDSIVESINNVELGNPSYPSQIRAYPMDQVATGITNRLAPGANVDFQGTNPKDAGMRVILPGVAGTTNLYYVRVRSSNKIPGVVSDPYSTTGGVTVGAYKLHLRLQEKQEIAGSTVRFADLRYATNGVEIYGNPMHSPLVGEFAELPNDTSNEASSALNIGNVMVNDRAGVSIAGTLALASDIDWFNFEVGRDEDSIQKLPSTTANPSLRVDAHGSLIFDLDYADGLGRANTQLWIFERGPGGQLTLVLTADDSSIQDDQPAILKGSDQEDLTRGSIGKRDAYIGPIELPPGDYAVAITNKSVSAVGLRQFTQSDVSSIPGVQNLRLEPLDSVARLGEDRFEPSNPLTTASGSPVVFSGGQVPFTLSDVTLFASRSTSMSFVNAMTGALEANMSRDGITTVPYGFTARDVAVSPAGTAMGFNVPTGAITDANSGQFFGIDIGDTGLPVPAGVTSGITTWAGYLTDADPPALEVRQSNLGGAAAGDGMVFTALTYTRSLRDVNNNDRSFFFGVGSRRANGSFNETPFLAPRARNILYRLNPDTGAAVAWNGAPLRTTTDYLNGVYSMTGTAGTDIPEAGYFSVGGTGAAGVIHGVTSVVEPTGEQIYGVSNLGELVRPAIVGLSVNPVLVATITDPATGTAINFTGLTRGPANVEGGRFANMLFGVSTTGRMYAFNTAGVLQPIFPLGATSIQLDFAPTGIDFSSLDRNLWHVSGGDPDSLQTIGHGRAQTFNQSGDSQDTGNNTIRFAVPFDLQNGNVYGSDNFSQLQNTYAMPGGTRGAFESTLLDLSSYSADDQPVMYFNYNLRTQNDTANADGNIFGDGSQTSFFDSFRVYGAGADGQWVLLTTNNSAGFQDTSYADGMMFPPFSEYDVPRNGNQDAFGRSYISSSAFDNQGWRQARVNLGALAGKRDVKIRFEFNSGGDFYTNDPLRGGIELSAVPGNRIADGDFLDMAQGTSSVRFEFDLGLVLNVPSGRSLKNGDQIKIGANFFTFAAAAGVNQIAFSNTDSPETVANSIVNVLSAAGYTVVRSTGSPNVLNVTHFRGDRLPDAVVPTDYAILGADPAIIQGRPGVTSRTVGGVPVPNVRIFVNNALPAVPAAQASITVLGDTYRGGLSSFADVASASLYNPNVGAAPIVALQNPNAALGAPDYTGGTAEPVGGDGVVSLGSGGVMVVQFTDNYLTGNNVTGTTVAARDLAVYEVGDPELVRVEVSSDGIFWTFVGNASSTNRYFDLDQFGFNSDSLLQYVRLTDLAGNGATTGDSVGADIDAVGALSSRQRNVRDEVRIALAQGLNVAGQENNMEAWRYDRDTIRIYGAGLSVTNAGPLRLSGGRVGDLFGPRDTSFQFTQAALRAVNNGTTNGVRTTNGMSLTIDDIVISFAERGEMVTGAQVSQGNPFLPTFQYELYGGADGAPAQEIETGAYQLEIRTAPDYGKTEGQNLAIEPVPFVGPKGRTFNTNDRMVKAIAIDTTGLSSKIGDGYNFNVSNGVNQVTFEFNVFTSTAGSDPAYRATIPGRFRIPLAPNASDGAIARAVRDAINDNAVRALLGLTAQIQGDMFGTGLFNDTLGNRIQINGEVASDLFGGSTFNILDPSGNPVLLPNPGGAPVPLVFTTIKYGQDTQWGEDLGDGNILREQGQIIISGATVLNSSQYGINLRPTPRDLGTLFINMDPIPNPRQSTDPRPISTESIQRSYPGAVRNMITLNNSRIASGPVLVNNILAKNGLGGIRVGGDQTAGGPDAPVTVARIVNNTLYGNDRVGNQTGIDVEPNTSPTILSNIVSNFGTAINVANNPALLSSIVIGANIYKGNTAPVVPASLNGSQAFPIFLSPSQPLFKDPAKNQFYLQSFSPAIDSSIASLEDRNLLDQVRAAVGLPTSPIIAPEFDAYGLLRSDDPTMSTPSGLGSNVFADRGAIDRVDSNGPLAVLQRPLDNDSAGNDQDGVTTSLRLKAGNYDYFEILIDERQGTGPDPDTITKDNVILTENGRMLSPDAEYVFGYSFNSRTIRLTPLAGFWRQDSVYEITLINKPTLRILAPSDAASRLDGQTFAVALAGGGTRTLELDSGFTLTVPPAGVTDGQFFSYRSASGQTTVFEFNLAGNIQTQLNTEVITFTTSDTRDTLAGKIAAALGPFVRQNGWPVQAIGGGRVAVGGNVGDDFDVSGSSLALSGNPGVSAVGRIPIRFLPIASFDAIAMANSLTKAFNQIGSGVKAYTLANGLVFVEGINSVTDFTTLSLAPINDLAGNLLQANRANSLTQFTILMPEVAVDYGDAVERTGTGSTSSTRLVDNGVRHAIYPDDATLLVLGASADGDTDGAPSNAADSDDFDSSLSLGTLSPFVSIDRNGPARLLTSSVSASSFGKTLTITDASGNSATYQFVNSTNPLTDPAYLPVDLTGLTTSTQVATALKNAVLNSILAGSVTGIYAESTGNVVSLGGSRNHLFDLSGAGSEITRALSGTLGLTINSSLTGLAAGQSLSITDGSGNTVGFQIINSAAPTPVATGSYAVTVDLATVTPASLATALASAINTSIGDARLRLPSVSATGASLVVSGDDEDGFAYDRWFNKDALPTAVTLTASTSGLVDAWIDWNQDNDFNDAGERILASEPVLAGANTFYIATPATAVVGFTTARFRLSSTGDQFTYGLAIGGEVEDHLIEVLAGSPPVGTNDTFTIAEDNLLVVSAPGVLVNDSDPDSNPIRVDDANRRVAGVQPVREPAFGYLTLRANGSFDYMPKQDFFGTDLFIYDVTDGRMTGNRSVTVTITVTPVNDAPVAVDDTVSILEDTVTTWNGSLFTANDRTQPDRPAGTDGDLFDTNESLQILTVTDVQLVHPRGLGESISVTSNQITYTPPTDYNNRIDGPVLVRVLIEDSGVAGGDADPKNPGDDDVPFTGVRYSTLTINIGDVNDRPQFNIPLPLETPLEDASVTRTNFLTNIAPSASTALDELGPTTATPSLVRQDVVFLVRALDPTRFTPSGQPAISPDGTLTYSLNTDVNFLNSGPILVEVIAEDNGNAPGSRPGVPDLNRSLPQTFTIRPTEVNDPPQFVIPNPLVRILEDLENSPLTGFVTDIFAGPSTARDERGEIVGVPGQTVRFVVEALDSTRFSTQPAISPTGVLTYDLSPDVNRLNSGDIIVRVYAEDNGPAPGERPGIPDVNRSDVQLFTIRATEVNDAPQFSIPNPIIFINEDLEVSPVNGFLTNIQAGPDTARDELGLVTGVSGQAVSFIVEALDPSRFLVQPQISPAGNLTYDLRPDINLLNSGDIIVRVFALDNGPAAGDRPGIPDVNQSANQFFTIRATEVNDAPQFIIPSPILSITEDLEVSPIVGFIANIQAGPNTALDELGLIPGVPGQSVSFDVVALDPTRFAVQPQISPAGTLTYDLNPDVNRLNSGDIVVRVTAVDNGPAAGTRPGIPDVNRSLPQFFTIRVAEINDAPQFTITNPVVRVEEDNEQVTGSTPTRINGFASNVRPGPSTAVDEVTQTLAFVILSSSNPNLFRVQPSIDPSGNLSFVTAADQNGSSELVIRLDDNGVSSPAPNDNTSNLATFTIVVRPVNDAPQFTIPNTIVSDEDQGDVTVAGFARDIRPGPETAFDELRQDLTFEVEALDSSVFESQPSLTPDGTLTYKTTADLNSNFGKDGRVRVRLRDSGVSGPPPDTNVSAWRTFTLTINPINDPPIPGPFTTSTNEDTRITIQSSAVLAGARPGPPGAVDEISETLRITNIESTTVLGGTILPVISGGQIVEFQYIPPLNFVGQDIVRYVVTDSGTYTPGPRSSTGTLTINILAINDPPVFTPGLDVTVLEDAAAYSAAWASNIAAGPASAVDELSGPGAQTVSFEVTNNNNGMFSTQPAVSPSGQLTFTLAKDANGQVAVVVTAVDSGLASPPPNNNRSRPSTFTITVGAVNDPPDFAVLGSISVDEDSGAFTGPVLGSIVPAIGNNASPPTALDESTQSVTFTTTNDQPALFAVQPSISPAGILTFSTASNATGTAVVRVTATDNGPSNPPNQNTSATKIFTITIGPVNDAPLAVDDRYNASETTVLNVAAPGLLGNDIDVDPDKTLSIATFQNVSELGAQVSVNPNGSFSYNPTVSQRIRELVDGQTITDRFTYRSKDSSNAQSNLATVTITVSGFNDAPVTVNDSFTVPFNTSRLLSVLDNDTDIDTPINVESVEIGILPVNGTASPTPDGRIRYTPNGGFRGTDSFTYRVRDSLGKVSAEATVSLRINTVPVANSDSFIAKQGVVTTLNVLSNDTDPDGVINASTVTIISQPNNATATVLGNGQIQFTSQGGFLGTSRFQYTVSDNDGSASLPADVSVQVVSSLYQNPTNRFDVNADTFVSPIDVLVIVNLINSKGPGWNGSTSGLPGPPDYVDVNGNDTVEPMDALAVINFINSGGTSGGTSGGEGEGRSAVASASHAANLGWTFDLGLNPNSSMPSTASRRIVGYGTSWLPPANAAQPLGSLLRSASGRSLADYLASIAEEDEVVEDAIASDALDRNRSSVDEALANLFDD